MEGCEWGKLGQLAGEGAGRGEGRGRERKEPLDGAVISCYYTVWLRT